jgi:hypothetical protein
VDLGSRTQTKKKKETIKASCVSSTGSEVTRILAVEKGGIAPRFVKKKKKTRKQVHRKESITTGRNRILATIEDKPGSHRVVDHQSGPYKSLTFSKSL